MSLAKPIAIAVDWDSKHKSHIQNIFQGVHAHDVHAHVIIRHSRKICRLDRRFTQTK